MGVGTALGSETKNRWILVSSVVTKILLLILLGNLVYTWQTLAHLEETHLSLEHAASELPFHIQGMQTSVRLAAESGDLTWRQRHQEHRQAAESTLKRIDHIETPPTVAKAADNLYARLEEADTFYQRAFERLINGEKEAAKAILGSWPYIRNRNALRQGSEEIARLLRENVRQRLAQQQRLVGGTVVAVLLLSLVTLLSWSVAVRNWNLNVRQRQEKEAEILYLSYHDPLTGLPNRRRFFEQANSEIARTNRYGHSLAVLMLDIDHFKWINDTFGHSVGDQVLVSLSEALVPELRDSDLLARLGGEEFAVLLVETELRTAVKAAERLRQAGADMAVDHEGQAISITVSIGVASAEGGKAELDTLLWAADEALYHAKKAGRDRVQSNAVKSLVENTT
jgi:diguanylate cyclase (GGDEF)-like protein